MDDNQNYLKDLDFPESLYMGFFDELLNHGYATDVARGGIVEDKIPLSPSTPQKVTSGNPSTSKQDSSGKPTGENTPDPLSVPRNIPYVVPGCMTVTDSFCDKNKFTDETASHTQSEKTANKTASHRESEKTLNLSHQVKEKLANCVNERKLPEEKQRKGQSEKTNQDNQDKKDKQKERNRSYAEKSRIRKKQELESLQQENKQKEAIIEMYKKCLTLYHVAIRGEAPDWDRKSVEWYSGQEIINQEPMKIECLLPVDPLIAKLGNSSFGSILGQSVVEAKSQEVQNNRPSTALKRQHVDSTCSSSAEKIPKIEERNQSSNSKTHFDSYAFAVGGQYPVSSNLLHNTGYGDRSNLQSIHPLPDLMGFSELELSFTQHLTNS